MIHFEDVRNKNFVYQGDKYIGFHNIWNNCPRITGCPTLTWQPSRIYKSGTTTQKYVQNVAVKTKEAKHKRLGRYGGTKEKIVVKKRYRTRTQPIFRKMHAPNECKLIKLINWPFEKLGGYQAAITGTYGSGKSNCMNAIIAHHLAQDVSILMFNDRRFEARSLCDKGYFDDDGIFHPFLVDVLVPSGYQFTEKSDPLWNHRNNVSRVNWSESDDIINNLAPHKLTVVYTECFDQASVLKLWIDLMQIIAREVSPEQTYIYTHHEFSSLIPETPTRDIAKIVREASNTAMNLRKDKIGIITTFHMLSEVYYRLSQKFTYIIYRRPTIRKSMTKAEEDAQGFARNKMNIVSGGRWRTHTIGMFPEVKDKYRIVPTKTDIIYPKPEPPESDSNEHDNDIPAVGQDPLNYMIMHSRARGLSYRKIAAELSLSIATIYNRAKALGIAQEIE